MQNSSTMRYANLRCSTHISLLVSAAGDGERIWRAVDLWHFKIRCDLLIHFTTFATNNN
jgi:hypothetical protein